MALHRYFSGRTVVSHYPLPNLPANNLAVTFSDLVGARGATLAIKGTKAAASCTLGLSQLEGLHEAIGEIIAELRQRPREIIGELVV